MPVCRALLASCLGALALLPTDAVRADTTVAALDRTPPAPEPIEPDLDCLALNIYWEARSESLLGQVAVAAVTLNRVAAPGFPGSVCEVVFQGEERGRHLCQFSWRCDGRADQPRNLVAWEEARRIARLALSDGVADPTGGALWYHADHVLPRWAGEMMLQARIGHHLFYGRPAPAETSTQPTGDIAVSFDPPEPMSDLIGASEEMLDSLSGELRIDHTHDPAAALLFCDDDTLCGQALRQVEAGRAARTTVPSQNDQRTLDPDLSAGVVAPPRAGASAHPPSLEGYGAT
jgi:hypothetical protein